MARIHSSFEETNDLLHASMATITSTYAALDLIDEIKRMQVGGPHPAARRPR